MLTTCGYLGLVLLGGLVISYALWAYAWPRPADPATPVILSAQILHPGLLRIHATVGALALLVGLAQAGPWRRRMPLSWHRRAGYVYVSAVLISGLAGLWLARSAEGGRLAQWGFGSLAVLWLGTTAWGVRSAIRGEAAAHRRAMVRSLALACAGIMLRVQLPLCGLAGWEFAASYPWAAWTCWVPNLVFADYLLRRNEL